MFKLFNHEVEKDNYSGPSTTHSLNFFTLGRGRKLFGLKILSRYFCRSGITAGEVKLRVLNGGFTVNLIYCKLSLINRNFVLKN